MIYRYETLLGPQIFLQLCSFSVPELQGVVTPEQWAVTPEQWAVTPADGTHHALTELDHW